MCLSNGDKTDKMNTSTETLPQYVGVGIPRKCLFVVFSCDKHSTFAMKIFFEFCVSAFDA